jgi:predicted outer membrane repeat protein
LLAALPASAQSDVVYVDEDAGGAGDGSSWDDAYTQLQDGLADAQSGEEVWVAYGTYVPDNSSNAARDSSFALRDGVGIYGGFEGNEDQRSGRDVSADTTTLSGDVGFEGFAGDNAYHVVDGTRAGSNAVLDGFYITAGSANGSSEDSTDVGAGMYIAAGDFRDASEPDLRNLTFEDNTSLSDGAGLFNVGSPTLTDVAFKNNAIAGTEGQGGGIYSEGNLTIDGGRFNSNTAVEDGGGLYFNDTGGFVDMSNAAFNDNVAGQGMDVDASGGGAYVRSNETTLDSVAFRRNSSTEDGGGMYASGSSMAQVERGLFVENVAGDRECCEDARGGGLHAGRGVVLSNAVFRDNIANDSYDRGGGLYSGFSNNTALTNVTFEGNAATGSSRDNGGGMYGSASELTDVTFLNNRADSSSTDYGGGLYLTGGNPTLSNVTFEGNFAAGGDGGGMWSEDNVTFTDVNFVENTAGRYGGGLYSGSGDDNSNGNVFAENVVFNQNAGQDNNSSGGAIYSTGGTVDLYDAEFYGNEAVDRGGAVYQFSSSGTIANAVFSGNAVGDAGTDGDGGALYNEQNSSPTIRNVTFANNFAAGRGGAIYDTLRSGPTVSNSILWENQAEGPGNQMYNAENSQPLVANSVIQGGVPEGAFDGGDVVTDDPMFANADGDDGTVGTADDDLMITDGSSALDQGANEDLPADEPDLDDDGDTSERLPLDLAGGPRIKDNDGDPSTSDPMVDAGAYEASSDVQIPVELVALKARVEGQAATLSWQTASETNNDRFEVLHRGVEAESFEPIGTRDGAGTTTEAQRYRFATDELAVGAHAFRLRQVDDDGAATLSDPVEVEVGVAGAFELSEAYPNPAREQARLTLAVAEAQEVEAAAYDARGRRVAVLFDGTLDASDTETLRVEAESLASGVYFVRVEGETFRATRKLVLVR